MAKTFEQLQAEVESLEFKEQREKEQEKREQESDAHIEGLANLMENSLPGCHYGHKGPRT